MIQNSSAAHGCSSRNRPREDGESAATQTQAQISWPLRGRSSRENDSRTEQKARFRGFRHVVQQTRLRSRKTLLVSQLYSAQCTYRTRPRRLVQSGTERTSHTEV